MTTTHDDDVDYDAELGGNRDSSGICYIRADHDYQRGEFASAQVRMLQALYYELRHGHDKQAEQAEVLAAHTAAVKDLAGVMDRVAAHLGDR